MSRPQRNGRRTDPGGISHRIHDGRGVSAGMFGQEAASLMQSRTNQSFTAGRPPGSFGQSSAGRPPFRGRVLQPRRPQGRDRSISPIYRDQRAATRTGSGTRGYSGGILGSYGAGGRTQGRPRGAGYGRSHGLPRAYAWAEPQGPGQARPSLLVPEDLQRVLAGGVPSAGSRLMGGQGGGTLGSWQGRSAGGRQAGAGLTSSGRPMTSVLGSRSAAGRQRLRPRQSAHAAATAAAGGFSPDEPGRRPTYQAAVGASAAGVRAQTDSSEQEDGTDFSIHRRGGRGYARDGAAAAPVQLPSIGPGPLGLGPALSKEQWEEAAAKVRMDAPMPVPGTEAFRREMMLLSQLAMQGGARLLMQEGFVGSFAPEATSRAGRDAHLALTGSAKGAKSGAAFGRSARPASARSTSSSGRTGTEASPRIQAPTGQKARGKREAAEGISTEDEAESKRSGSYPASSSSNASLPPRPATTTLPAVRGADSGSKGRSPSGRRSGNRDAGSPSRGRSSAAGGAAGGTTVGRASSSSIGRNASSKGRQEAGRSTSGTRVATRSSGAYVSAWKQREEEKKRKRRERRNKKRQAAREKERAREAAERKMMLEEEWAAMRAYWWGTGPRSGRWRTVRCFLSSSFRDMHGERDSLTRTVFPALNYLAKSRRVKVIGIDLRWGLTAEDSSDSGLGALEHCLLEVDHSRPFCLVLSGERYGWRPPSYRVSDRPEFDWVRTFSQGHSITAMEIFHAFLRKYHQPTHAICMQRDPAFMDTIDPKDRWVFEFDGDDEALILRDNLREDMKYHPFCTFHDYNCEYGGIDEEGKPVVTGLEDFERVVLEDMWQRIKSEFPPPPPPPSQLDLERSFHQFFIQERSRTFIGREALLDRLERHANGDASGESLPLVVSGVPGSGKTSLVCHFAKRYQAEHPTCFTLVHVVSASPTSTDIRETLVRLCKELALHFYGLNFDAEDEEAEYADVRERFTVLLAEAGQEAIKANSHVLLVMDAINQLNPFHNSYTGDWLPAYSPAGVRTIVSTTPEAAILQHLMRRDPPPPQVEVPALSVVERKEIVVKYLAVFRKRLLQQQLDLIMKKKDSHKPLYLMTVSEELRLQAQYGADGSGVDDTIRYFPGSIPELMSVVLERVERDLSQWARSLDPGMLEGFDATARSTDENVRAEAAAEVEGRAEEEEETEGESKAGAEESKEGDGIVLEGDEDNGAVAASGAGADNPADKSAPLSVVAARVGKHIVSEALCLLECSRHGLREYELLELLAPRDRERLPPVVWARLYRSLEIYLRPVGEEDQGGTIGFFHLQLPFAIRRRYLEGATSKEAAVCTRLADYFQTKADPTEDGRWLGTSKRYVSDLVYYQLTSHDLARLKSTLGDILFIERTAQMGAGMMERLLRDFNEVQEVIRSLPFAVLKRALRHMYAKEGSRAAQLQWIGEYGVFVAANHSTLTAEPYLTFYSALNSPSASFPHIAAQELLDEQLRAIDGAMDVRERDIETTAARLLEPQMLDRLAILANKQLQEQRDARAAAKSSSSRRGGVAMSRSGPMRRALAPAQSFSQRSRSGGAGTRLPRSRAAASQYGRRQMLAAGGKEVSSRMSRTGSGVSPTGRGMGSARSFTGGRRGGNITMLTALPAVAEGGGGDDSPVDEHVDPIIREMLRREIIRRRDWDLARVTRSMRAERVPRRFFQWLNKPQRSRIVADFAGLSSEVTCLAVPPDSSAQAVAVAFKDGNIQQVDSSTGEMVKELVVGGHTDAVRTLSYSGDSIRLVSGGDDHKLVVWDVSSGVRLDELVGHEGGVTAAVWIENYGRYGLHDDSFSDIKAAETEERSGRSGKRDRGGAAVSTGGIASRERRQRGHKGGRRAGNSRRRHRIRRGARSLLTASLDGGLILWREKTAQGATGTQETTYESQSQKDWMPSPAMSLAFSEVTGIAAAGHADGSVQVWDARVPALGLIDMAVIQAHRFTSVSAITFSPDGRRMLTATMDCELKVWRRRTRGGEVVWEESAARGGSASSGGHSASITTAAFSADGQRFLTAGLDKKVIMWDSESAQELTYFSGHSDAVYCAAFMYSEHSSGGKQGARYETIVSGSYDKTIKVWDASASERELESTAIIRRVGESSSSYTDGGRYSGLVGGLATRESERSKGSGSDSAPGSRPRGGRRFSFSGHAIQPAPSIASVGRTSPGSGSVVVGGEKSPASGGGGLMDRVLSRAQNAAAGRGMRNMGKSGRSLAAQFAHSIEQTRGGGSGDARSKGPVGSHSDRVTASTVSEDGSIAVTGSADCEIKVWNLENGSEACVLIGHEAPITSLCLSVSKAMLASGDEDGVVNLWDGQSFEHLMTLNAWYKLQVTCLAFAEVTIMDREAGRAGRKDLLIAACGDGRCKAWDTLSGVEHETPIPHVFDGPIVAMRYLVSGASALPDTAMPAPVNSGVLDRSLLPSADSISELGSAIGLEDSSAGPNSARSRGSDAGSRPPNSARSSASGAQPTPRSGVWAAIGSGSTNPFAALVIAARKEKQRQKHVLEQERERANSPAYQAYKSPRVWELSGQKLTKAIKSLLNMYFVEDSDGLLGSLTADSALAQALADEGVQAVSSVASVDPNLADEVIRSLVRGGIRAWVTEGAGVKQLGIVGGTHAVRSRHGQLAIGNGESPAMSDEADEQAAAAAKRNEAAGISARDRVLKAHADKLTIGIGAPEKPAKAISGTKSTEGSSRRSRRRGGLPPSMASMNASSYALPPASGAGAGGRSGRKTGNMLDRMVSFDAHVEAGRRESMDAIARRQSSAVDPVHAKRVAAQDEDECSFVYGTTDPKATVAGITPMHTRDRLALVGADGSFRLLDLNTMEMRHEDRCPGRADDIGRAVSRTPGVEEAAHHVHLAAACISHDGSRIAVAPESSIGDASLSIGPLASLYRLEAADVVGALPMKVGAPGEDKQRGVSAARKLRKRQAETQRRAAARRQRKLEREVARYQERIRRKRRQRSELIAKLRAEREAAKKKRKEEGDEDDDDDDDEDDEDLLAQFDMEGDEDGEAGGRTSASEQEDDTSDDEEEEQLEEEADKAAEMDEEARRRVRHVQAVDFALDGSLCAVGCRERHMVVLDPSRPEKGPLGLFMAMGEVTTVAMGQGVRPWNGTDEMYAEEARLLNRLWDLVGDEMNEEEQQGRRGEEGGPSMAGPTAGDSLTGDDLDVHGDFGEDFAAAGSKSPRTTRGRASRGGTATSSPGGSRHGRGRRSAGGRSSRSSDESSTNNGASGRAALPQRQKTVIPESLRQAAKKLLQKTIDGKKTMRRRVGDGRGGMGVVVVGDATGAVFVLRLQDVLRTAEAKRHQERLATVKKELEALEQKKREEEAKALEEQRQEDEAEQLRIERRKTVPMRLFEFNNGRRAVAAEPDKLLQAGTKDGRRLVREILATLGLDIGLVRPDRAKELRAACPFHLRRPRPLLTFAEAVKLRRPMTPLTPRTGGRAQVSMPSVPSFRAGGLGAGGSSFIAMVRAASRPHMQAGKPPSARGSGRRHTAMVVRADSERRVSSARGAREDQLEGMGGSTRNLETGEDARPRSAAAARSPPSAGQTGSGGRPPTHRDRPSSARSVSSLRSLDLDGPSPADIRAMSAERRRRPEGAPAPTPSAAAGAVGIPEGIDPEALVPPEEEALLGVEPDHSALLTDAFGVADRDRGRALVRRLRLATRVMLRMSPRSDGAASGGGAGGGSSVQPASRRSPKAGGGSGSAAGGTAVGRRLVSPSAAAKRSVGDRSRGDAASGKPADSAGVNDSGEMTAKEKAELGDLDLNEERDVAEARSRYFCRPRALFCVFGGASGLHDLLVPGLRSLIKRGVVTAAVMMGGVMLTGGTKAGVMDMVGAALQKTEEGPLRIIGVCPRGVIQPPKTILSDGTEVKDDADDLGGGQNNTVKSFLADLEPHHTNFLLIPSDEWGGETTSMYAVIQVMRLHLPSVAVLANGGGIAQVEIYKAVEVGMSVVVIDGSGRLADKIAKYIKMREEYYDKAMGRLKRNSSTRSGMTAASGASSGSGGGAKMPLEPLPEASTSRSADEVGGVQAETGSGERTGPRRVEKWTAKMAGVTDDGLAFILDHGDIFLFPVHEPPAALQDLLYYLVVRDRKVRLRRYSRIGRHPESDSDDGSDIASLMSVEEETAE